jgi:NAD(P)-dependent dehydrogenase (short-subunit alcohol dehydrogenase family)
MPDPQSPTPVPQKVIIITGASRGLGAAVARMVARFGAVAVLNARSEDGLSAVAQEIWSAGGEALVIPGDIGQLPDCWHLAEETIAHYGRIDALVNNAAVIEPVAPLERADPVAWRRSLHVNVLGPMMLTQAALPSLRQSGGRVINVSSGAATRAMVGWSAYCVTKAALNHFNRQLAAEEPDITAIAVRPGVVDTAMQETIRVVGEKGMTAEDHARFVDYYEHDELLPPERPGKSLAALALYAPEAWSGQFLSWDDEEVVNLVKRLG